MTAEQITPGNDTHFMVYKTVHVCKPGCGLTTFCLFPEPE